MVVFVTTKILKSERMTPSKQDSRWRWKWIWEEKVKTERYISLSIRLHNTIISTIFQNGWNFVFAFSSSICLFFHLFFYFISSPTSAGLCVEFRLQGWVCLIGVRSRNTDCTSTTGRSFPLLNTLLWIRSTITSIFSRIPGRHFFLSFFLLSFSSPVSVVHLEN